MNDGPISFRVCDFSEQLVPPTPANNYYVYSAVMHVDGAVYHHRRALRRDGFEYPLPSLRSEAWLKLLEQVTKDRQ